MTLSEIFLTMMSTTTPVLPGAALLRLALPVMWAMVLAGCVMVLGTRLPRPWQLGLTGVVVVWALIPGPLSVTYWLGLAFQLPSLMTVLMGAGWLVAGLTRRKTSVGSQNQRLDRVGLLGIWGVALGWLLLLDTFAVLPWSIYSFGFSTASLVVVSVLAVLLWAVKGKGIGLVLTATALTLFVATRLPTGNLWDALIDPWLWVVLQVVWLRRLWGQRQA